MIVEIHSAVIETTRCFTAPDNEAKIFSISMAEEQCET